MPIALLVCGVALLAVISAAQADSLTLVVTDSRLPTPLREHFDGRDGDYILIFGGYLHDSLANSANVFYEDGDFRGCEHVGRGHTLFGFGVGSVERAGVRRRRRVLWWILGQGLPVQCEQ